ncbi:8-amino-7-oxononanoate synthase [Rosistilla carotiformis]|uniref:8-amino-7-oxononanoate synthase n=1 Tax=Rosistilla carotiformis TaxID=2528017 RepID=A0A518K0G4_9BACT|nr:aminotransferase class I/II-fold pyridoxal phosphate-dependent enzyme [Rosistilla carotiformis]QDV71292.1 8-amino-7-oxononanoate synthase [Rosistilla carotiformis]
MSVKSSLERLKMQIRRESSDSEEDNAAKKPPQSRGEVKASPAFYQFDKFPEYKEFTTMEWYLDKEKYPRTQFLKRLSVSDATVNLEGREMINYSTYNYLGLAGDARVKEAAKRAVDTFGTSTGSGRSITGEIELHRAFENEICEVLGTEDAVLSVGGYSTNTFAIGYLCRNKDLILYDELIHNSALAGCKMTAARRIGFPHNDYEALEALLAENRGKFERVLILVEGVYSMDGDIPDLPRLIDIKRRYKALLMVDEAHSFGIIGPNGLGVTDYFDFDPHDVDIYFGSLSKSFGTCGGYIAGPKPLIAMLKYFAPGVLLYGAAPTPANTAAGLEALRIMRAEPQRARRLVDNARYFVQRAKAAGLDTYNSHDSAVVPLMCRDSELALWLSMALFGQGICAYPMLHPIVPRDKSRLRFFINTFHTHQQLDYTIQCIVDNLRVAPKSKGVF